jgi:hypothetical protein
VRAWAASEEEATRNFARQQDSDHLRRVWAANRPGRLIVRVSNVLSSEALDRTPDPAELRRRCHAAIRWTARALFIRDGTLPAVTLRWLGIGGPAAISDVEPFTFVGSRSNAR